MRLSVCEIRRGCIITPPPHAINNKLGVYMHVKSALACCLFFSITASGIFPTNWFIYQSTRSIGMVMRTVGPLGEKAWAELERVMDLPPTKKQKEILDEAKRILESS